MEAKAKAISAVKAYPDNYSKAVTNVIEKITSKEQYLEYVKNGYLDYSYYILRNLSNL
jgi:hypothetical protein